MNVKIGLGSWRWVRERVFEASPFGLNPGQNQEAGIVDDERQFPLLRVLLPVDEALARGELSGTGAEAEQGDQARTGEDDVAAWAVLAIGVWPR